MSRGIETIEIVSGRGVDVDDLDDVASLAPDRTTSRRRSAWQARPVSPARESEPISRMLNGWPAVGGTSPATFTLWICVKAPVGVEVPAADHHGDQDHDDHETHDDAPAHAATLAPFFAGLRPSSFDRPPRRARLVAARWRVPPRRFVSSDGAAGESSLPLGIEASLPLGLYDD